MKILLSNDDGYYASGIQSLINELSVAHDIFVAAPSVNQSAGTVSYTHLTLPTKA